MYRATFADGSVLRVRHDREAMAEEIRDFADAREAAAFGEFCEWLDEIYTVGMPNFVDANYDNVATAFGAGAPACALIRKGGFKRFDTKLASFFEDERLQRIFSFQSLQAGLAPHDALAVLAVRTYMEAIGGVFMAPRWHARHRHRAWRGRSSTPAPRSATTRR